MRTTTDVRRVRALFISDVHLGMRSIRTDALIDFLATIEADAIYLVGDIIDGWRLRKSWHWPPQYNLLVQSILERARQGCRVVYLPGNHDEFLRDHFNTNYGDVELHDRLIHIAADGRTYLVIHGDQFDIVVRHAKWLAHIGDWAYNTMLRANVVLNWVRRRLGKPYWSLSAWAKRNVKNAASFIGRFEEALSHDAKMAGVDGVICGHIHNAAMHQTYGVHYINCGDWVESCTAVIETFDGNFELIRWPAARRQPAPSRRRKRQTVFDRLLSTRG
ncbi:UDP-2,3-diacylglucosamine diphosphatase [Pelagibacterium halotolerans]|uniref:UDP-2,3-diacylglucosamine diphosphatase n=1 Tax=Pelagibacterium halotolerans TaxID=531813 RepID=UPI0038509BFC